MAGSATYTVNMDVRANTSQALSALQNLKTTLSEIQHMGVTSSGTSAMTADMKAATEAAQQLRYHLQQATNVSTGKLDLSLLNKSLASSKTSITELTRNFASCGAAGTQAMNQLAQSIIQAETPTLRINSAVERLWNTFKGSLRWEVAARALQGGLSTIQKAVSYAKNLNESLNDIRIVSGESAESMADFAKYANKAAKELSATTLDVTRGAEIYYQQGPLSFTVQKVTQVKDF